jgi:membrane-bound lytic murein transglycosylase B
LSAVFSRLNALERLSGETSVILDEVKNLKASLENQKVGLEVDKAETERVLKINELQKAQEETTRAEQQKLYGMTEAEYQAQLTEKQELERQASEIRNRIFELAGTSTTEAPSFEEAYRIAKKVEEKTGVRTAFILALLHQESGIGSNVGQCYIKDPITADGINIQTGSFVKNVMKPMGLPGRTGDVDDFLVITKELGLNPFNTPVSCPIPSVGGYGGAMGPAQFIPTTWSSYRSRLSSILGRPANPWIIEDSFFATGLYLQDYGAWTQTREAEWCAAQGYFTGKRCNPNHSFYGNNVLLIADQFERDIEIMLKNGN